MNKYGLIATCAAALIVIIAAAMAVVAPRRNLAVYRILMCNRTFREKLDVSVYFDGQFAAAAGQMVPGGSASFGPVRLQLPDQAELRWRDEQGDKSALVPIVGVPLNNLDDCLLAFIIEDNQAPSFLYIAPTDQEKYNNIGISLIPYRPKDKR